MKASVVVRCLATGHRRVVGLRAGDRLSKRLTRSQTL